MADSRDGKFRKARTAAARRKSAIQRDTMAEVRRLLDEADRQLTAILAGQPSDFAQWQLPIIRQSIRSTLGELGEGMAQAGAAGMTQSWEAGVALVDKPIEAGGVAISAVAPAVDATQLFAMRNFLTGLMRDVSNNVVQLVNTEIGLVALGAQGPADAIGKIADLVAGGRRRAQTIVRTELGRAFSAAGQQRMEQASGILPGLKKQWRRSGKVHSRIAHDLADGQIVGVDESFTVNGVKLRYPRDPAAPAAETVNCGCNSLPLMKTWDVAQPGRHPFSDQEVRLNPLKRDLDQALNG